MPLVQIRFVDERELSGALEALGADPRCHGFFHRKRETLCLQCLRVDTRAANALKQELLARGGDAAVHAHAIDRGVGESSVLLFGTLSQLRSLEEKLIGLDTAAARKQKQALLEAYGEKLHLTRGRVSAEYRKSVCLNLLRAFLDEKIGA